MSACTTDETTRRTGSCQSAAGLSSVMQGTGTVKLEALCNDGRMTNYTKCMQDVLSDCGIAYMYDFAKMGNSMTKVCQDAPVLDAASSCMEGQTSQLQECTTAVVKAWADYVKAGKSSDVTLITCSLLGGIKNCFRSSFDSRCGKAPTDVLIELIDGFSPTACHSYDSCTICGTTRTAQLSVLLLVFVFVFKQILV